MENINNLEKKISVGKVKNLLKGTQSLLKVKEILDDMGIKFFLIHGTLLGIVRDGFLLPHDALFGAGGDIDVASFNEMPDYMFGEFIRIVQKHGCKMFQIESQEWEGYRVVAAYIRGELLPWPIGIEFWKKIPGDKFLTYDQLKTIPSDYCEELIEIEYMGKTFNIPKNYDKFLEYNYGKSWRIPATFAIVNGKRVWAECDYDGNIIKPINVLEETNSFFLGSITNYKKIS